MFNEHYRREFESARDNMEEAFKKYSDYTTNNLIVYLDKIGELKRDFAEALERFEIVKNKFITE